MLKIDPKDAVPIWRQIEDGVRRLVASGALSPGAAIPSVRDLAKELRVNPATVSKAYQRLSDANVLTVRRGEGTFVADDPPSLTKGGPSPYSQGGCPPLRSSGANHRCQPGRGGRRDP